METCPHPDHTTARAVVVAISDTLHPLLEDWAAQLDLELTYVPTPPDTADGMRHYAVVLDPNSTIARVIAKRHF